MKDVHLFIRATVSAICVVGFLTIPLAAQERANDESRPSPNASVSQTIGTTIVSVSYGRPAVNDRAIFGTLVPYDKVWRTGANEATTITFSDDVQVEGKPVKAGTYGLFTIPGKNEWTIIFNNVPAQWGAFDYNESEDALRIKTAPERGEHMEQFMIYFENVTDTSGDVVLHWDTTRVPFTVET